MSQPREYLITRSESLVKIQIELAWRLSKPCTLPVAPNHKVSFWVLERSQTSRLVYRGYLEDRTTPVRVVLVGHDPMITVGDEADRV